MQDRRNCRGGTPWPPLLQKAVCVWAATECRPTTTPIMVQYSYRFLLLILILGFALAVANGQTERSSHFRIVHPATLDSRDTRYVLDLLERDRSELVQRAANAGIDARFPNLEIVFNASTGDLVVRTGMPPWAAAATQKSNRTPATRTPEPTPNSRNNSSPRTRTRTDRHTQ